jgi:RNA polymerase sigma-70 factor (ECF subfamily)
MADSRCASLFVPAGPAAIDNVAQSPSERVRALVEEHYDFVWRTLRHMGFADASAEDGAQQVMCVLARRIGDVASGAEKQFLFATTMRVAATLRRTAKRRPESGEKGLDALIAATPSPEDLLDERRAYAALERVLSAMPVELRIVFVLHEVEEMTTPEIAAILGIPVGTATSRLRRAREHFRALVDRLQQSRRGQERP